MNENKFLKDFFTRKYEDSIGNSNFYIAFEDCGFHISPQSFTDEITKQYSKNIEIEELSNYCNCVVPVCDTIPGHSSSTISDCIELLKATIQFNDKKTDGNASGLLPVFGNAVDKLKSQLEPLASTINGRSTFYRSNLNPDNFLDETNHATWTPYNESWSFPSTDQPEPIPGLVNPVWKIRPDMLQNFQSLQHNAIVEAGKPAVEAKFLKKRHATIGRTQFLKKKSAHIAPTAAPATLVVSPAALTKNASMANTFLSANAINADMAAPAQETNRFSKSLINSSFAKRNIAIQRLILDNDVAKKEDTPVKTSNVNIRFQYCIARITRPWLYKNILDINHSWYCTGLAEGFFSTGDNSADNKGKLPSLPVSMILIKDLSITATFNAGDWENAKKAVALDSLNIAEADFKDLGDNDHAIESKGVQIIGWVCEYLPKFPVCADPNLTPTT